jgi:hypothetical protein
MLEVSFDWDRDARTLDIEIGPNHVTHIFDFDNGDLGLVFQHAEPPASAIYEGPGSAERIEASWKAYNTAMENFIMASPIINAPVPLDLV